eukprot:TRINITY_DN326_c0_g1_i1.p1 TRINITY_DN326_c0_g1~~TRINITY_DN326_c0_g1_i1.p1  ORF type:complete len:452 (-),score=185.79 TRINITY_DN326_c0_g1_i1:84-1439(-)
MKRFTLFIICLALAPFILAAQEEEFERGYFSGRSAHINIAPKSIENPSIEFSTPVSVNTIKDTEVFGVISHELSMPNNGNPSLAVTQNIFSKPSANLFVVIDGVNTQDKQGLELQVTSQPRDTSALLTTLLSGQQPAQHGVTAKHWAQQRRVANVADLLAARTRGRAMIVGASADNSLLAAVTDKQHRSPASLAVDVQHVLAHHTALAGVQWTVDGTHVTITVNGQSARFDLSADLALITELLTAAEWTRVLEHNEEVRVMSQNSAPAMWSLVFSSLTGVNQRYGAQSAQYRVALAAITQVVAALRTQLTAVHGADRLAVQIVRVPHVSYSAVVSRLNSVLQREAKSDWTATLPAITLTKAERVEQVCTRVREVLGAEYDVHCPRVRAARAVQATTPDNTQVSQGVFQILFWMGVILMIIAIYVVMSFAFMEIKQDPLVFRNTISLDKKFN